LDRKGDVMWSSGYGHVGHDVPEPDHDIAPGCLLSTPVLVYCRDAVQPHPLAILIVKQQPALQQILVITIDGAADVTIGVGPLAGFNVDPSTDQPDGRAVAYRSQPARVWLSRRTRAAE